MVPDPAPLSALQALVRLRSGALTVEALARTCLRRIAERDADVRAWVHIDPDAVLKEARRLDAAGPKGPLYGLPVGVKDVILTADMPTGYNSPIHLNSPVRVDAACVALLRSAGALVFGKTDTVEFAATGRKAATRNPHDLTRTPGASSSGSAAAVADGHVPLALGTQTGGSVIRPASYCGVWAVKPTYSLVSNEGAKRFAPSLDTLGWFARSADDLDLLYQVLDRDPQPLQPLELRGARIGLCRSPAWTQAEPAARSALKTAQARLRAAGARVDRFDLPAGFDDLVRLHALIMHAEGAVSFLPEYRAAASLLDPVFRQQVETAGGVSRTALVEAYDVAASCRAAFGPLAAEYDAVVTPSSTGEAPVGLGFTGAMSFNGLWTLLHVPCVNVPGLTGPAGLPIGLTVCGPRFSDAKVLAAAKALGTLLAG